ncbi:MAG: phosphate acetyltransferase [Bacteroidales bacterium]|nr:phosphate acetyltransferase [Bacteroidales bacterium]
MDLLSEIKNKAKANKKRIVLPEAAEDNRTIKAADIILKEGIADLILLGDPAIIEKKAKELNLSNIGLAKIVDPLTHDKLNFYTDLMVELRHDKGVDKGTALKLIEDPLYLGVLMIKTGDADGEVAGAIHSTGETIRPAFQYIRTKPRISLVSGAFIMVLKNKAFGDNGIMVFADCAVNPEPNDIELAEIAVSTAETAKTIAGIEPRVAMLSFSTKGSAKHESASKVIRAVKIVKEMRPDLQIEGELQADAAIIESVAKQKAPNSKIAGKANVLVFPTLDAGNIAYKLVQRMADAEAIGPILQGLAAPINDLSRGCDEEDIVNLVAITALQAGMN